MSEVWTGEVVKNTKKSEFSFNRATFIAVFSLMLELQAIGGLDFVLFGSSRALSDSARLTAARCSSDQSIMSARGLQALNRTADVAVRLCVTTTTMHQCITSLFKIRRHGAVSALCHAF